MDVVLISQLTQISRPGLPNFLERVAEAARTVQRQMASGQVTVPLQFLQQPPAAAPPPQQQQQQQQRASAGRNEFTAYTGRAEFVPVGAA